MTAPLVSVIIPCYNQAHFLGEAIDSVLAQTYSEYEIIVVNDGSPDNILQVMEAYSDNPRILLHNQENKGLEETRNIGVSLAKGDYFQFLDADDWLHPEKFARQLEILESNTTIGLVYCDFYSAYSVTEISEVDSVKVRCLGPLEPEIFGSLWMQGIYPPNAPLVRREWIEKSGGFTKGLRGHEDWAVWLRITALGCQVKFLDQRLAYYRQHANNTSKNESLMHASLIKTRQLIAAQFPEKVGEATDFAIRRHVEMADEVRAWADKLQQNIYELKDNIQNERYQFQNERYILQTSQSELYQQIVEQNEIIARKDKELAAKNDHIKYLEGLIGEVESGKFMRFTRAIEDKLGKFKK